MRCISLFIFRTENYHYRVRSDLVNYLINNKSNFEQIAIETEIGKLEFNDYINYIKKPGSWGGDLEKYAAQTVYNINIVDYQQIEEFPGSFSHKYIYILNQDGNYNKDLCILSFISNNHYNLLFDKNYNCYLNENKFLIFSPINNNINNKKILINNNQSGILKKLF